MEKYKPIIDDWQAFKQESENHPVNAVRKNVLKSGPEFEERLGERFEYEEADWDGDIYRIETESPGKSLLHWRGEYYVQEESAALPVEVLDPRPGEKVLDMCAAPGGKTTQIAAKMRNRGLVVANDESGQRMKSLHANVYRTGSVIADATNYDARLLPEERFDRILVDAPCSGEGDRYRETFEAVDEKDSQGLADLQFQLLEKASNMVKDQGTVVYSTCTITPLENEAVVERAVEETGLKLVDIETEVEHVRGVNSFEQLSFKHEMGKTVRVYPHHLNSGAIFVAKFRKNMDSEPVNSDLETSPRTDLEEKGLNYMKERFDVDFDDVEGLELVERHDDLWLASEESTGYDAETRGIRALRATGIGLKPTTYLLQYLDDEISKNIVEINDEECEKLLAREDMISRDLDEEGYVALKYEDRVLGCGFYKNEKVSSRIPKGRSKELLKALF
jgi:NOL1/NOP2/sun family putative RNA methylase